MPSVYGLGRKTADGWVYAPDFSDLLRKAGGCVHKWMPSEWQDYRLPPPDTILSCAKCGARVDCVRGDTLPHDTLWNADARLIWAVDGEGVAGEWLVLRGGVLIRGADDEP